MVVEIRNYLESDEMIRFQGETGNNCIHMRTNIKISEIALI